MMTQKLAVAVLAAAAFAVQAAIFHFAVAAPLASAVGELRTSARAHAPTFEESITVVAAHPPHKVKLAKRS
jgi:hypothetical protein